MSLDERRQNTKSFSEYQMDGNCFTLPAPLSRFRAVVGTAHIFADTWNRFCVSVTLQNGRSMCIDRFSNPGQAENLASTLNDCPADNL